MFTSSLEIAALKTGKNRILGIDYGEKRTGLSLSDLTWTVATPFKTLLPNELLQNFATMVKAENIVAVIIGWPVNMDGSKSQQCEVIERFIIKLLSVVEIPIHAWDERLSTMAVHRTMIEADLSRKRQKEVVDKMASAYMLQGFLESLRTISSSS
jgi:putative Holliday junction resolvase